MSNIIEYKGYYATIEYNTDDNILVGTVQGIVDVIAFEAESIKDLKKAFEETIDDYLELCQSIGKDPDKAFKGSFNVRVSPETHKNAVRNAAKQGITLNEYVSHAIDEKNKNQQKATLNVTIQLPDHAFSPPRITNWEGFEKSNLIRFPSISGCN